MNADKSTVDAAHDRRQLGQLMVDEGIVTSDELAHALSEQTRTGRPLGEILVELGFASAGAVGNGLAEQHGGLLKTEYGVSAGLHPMTEAGLGNAPVRPMLPPPEERLAPKQPEAPKQPAAPLRVVVADPPAIDGPPVAPAPTAVAPEPPPLIPDADKARIADLTSRLDGALSQLRLSQQAREAFSKRVNELDEQLALAAPQADSAPQTDSAQAARIQQLETHIEALDAHIQALAVDRENIVQHYTQLQAQLAAAQLAAAQTAAPKADPAQATRIKELEAHLQAAAVDRLALVEIVTELERRLGEASQAREAEFGETSVGAAARVSVLEGQLKEASLDRGVNEQRVAELQGALLASEQARAGEIQSATAEALAHIAELELQLQQAVELNVHTVQSESGDVPESARVAELEAQFQAVTDERDAILAGLAVHDATLARACEDLADRDRQLADNVNEIARMNREHRAQFDQLEKGRAPAVADAPAVVDTEVEEEEEEEEQKHVLFTPNPSGYSMLERSGPPPAVGAGVEIGGDSESAGLFVVRKHGESVPGGPCCVYLERV